MKRSISIIGTLAILALAGCQTEGEMGQNPINNPDYDSETNTVRTQFILNIATETGDPTKTTAEYVQQDNKPFLGMEAVHLLAYSLPYKSENHGYFFYNPFDGDGNAIAAVRDYNLGSLFPAGSVKKDDATRIVELALPLGVNSVMLYGKALKTYGDDLQGKVKIDGNIYDLTSLTFELEPRLQNQAAYDVGAFLFSTMLTYFTSAGLVRELTFWNQPTGNADRSYAFWWPVPSASVLAQLPSNATDGTSKTVDNIEYTYHTGELSWKQLGTIYDYAMDNSSSTDPNTLVKTDNDVTFYKENPLGDVLGRAYSALTTISTSGTLQELRAGSASAVLRTMQDLYSIVESVASSSTKPTTWEENVSQLLGIQLKGRFDEYFHIYSGVLDFWRADDGTIDIAKLKTTLEKSCSTDKWTTNKSKINTYLSNAYFVNEDNIGFPVNVGLPKGAAIMQCTTSAGEGSTKGNQKAVDQFYYISDIPAYGLGDTSFPISNYCYPAELLYYGNSAIRTNIKERKDLNYPSSASGWETDDWLTWDSEDASVASDTRSVAMINTINYGTALLASNITFGAATLKDNNSGIHPGELDNLVATSYEEEGKGIFVTGVIVGGQASKVGWDFTRQPSNPGSMTIGYNSTTEIWEEMEFEGNAFDKMIYDKVPASVPYLIGDPDNKPIYTMVWDNYDHKKKLNEQSDVYVGVELLNNTGEDFWGEMGLIRNGGTFYLLGKLDLAKAVLKARTGEGNADKFKYFDRDCYCYPPYDMNGNTINAPRVFMQDYITTANLVIGEEALKHAYVTVPDLRTGQVSLGLSVDMKWETGLTFDVELGKL